MQSLFVFPRFRSFSGAHLVAFILIAALLALPLLAHPPAPIAGPAQALGQLALSFVPNQGQAAPSVLFEARGMGGQLAFAPQEIKLTLPATTAAQAQTLRLHFLGADPAPAVEASASLPGTVNYYNGADPAQWYTSLPTHAGITYQQLYPGIDLAYAGTEGHLKSTFYVAPGADPARIRWAYGGAASVTLAQASGELLIDLADQTQVVEGAPIAWQEIDGQRVPVTAAYAISEDGSVGFTLGNYDASAPLIIDPTIVYETTLNLGDFDNGLDIATDAGGNAYVLARVYDANNDVLIVKLSPNGTLLYTTYLRGSGGDFGRGIALDNAGGVYVAGGTDSADFPILNARQAEKNGVTREAFITKLDAQDGSLLFSTFFGGSRSDSINDITLNAAGEIYVIGQTESTDLPTVNPIQSGLNLNQCFCEDTFVTKFTSDALTILYSTYLGGSFEDYGQSIALDANDNIYITGRTQSDDFPTQAAIQPNRAGTNQDEDLFVAKIAADGSNLVYSTYLGGTENDFVRRIAVDSAGNAFVGGYTLSADFPTTAGAYRDAYIGGPGDCLSGFGLPVDCNDMFVTKFVPDGSSLAYSTYLGGTKHDYARGIALNDAGEAFVVGYTHSTDFAGATQASIVAAKLNASGSDLLYAVSIASAVANSGHGIAVDYAGDVYITGAQNAPSDLYVAKIADGGAPPPPTPTATATPAPPPPTSTPAPSPTPTPAPTATVTPTPPPSSDEIHVGDLDGNSGWIWGRWVWQASVTVHVHDANHNPVANATVSGTWSGGYSGSAQCTTGGDGQCTLSSGNVWRGQSSTTLTVDDVSHANYGYASGDNHDPDGDSDGSSIAVARP